jgi:NAD(P)-dependent dehydrogenase (short-subunit alcohol dehydrogenase family)
MLLSNKVVLITGSTTGIGEAIAERSLAEGALVMIHGRNEERAQEIVNRHPKDRVKYSLADLSHPEFSNLIIDDTLKAFGRIDVLINNAASTERDDINTITPASFEKIFNVNLKSPLFLSQNAIHHFRQQKSGGVIVNIGSINAYCGQSNLLSYSISKGAMMTMTRNLAEELGHEKIRVNQINMGWTLTANEEKLKQREGLPGNWADQVPAIFAPSGKLLTPEEVSYHVVFWASDTSAPATGVVYELEQYPIIGRNLINEIQFSSLKKI